MPDEAGPEAVGDRGTESRERDARRIVGSVLALGSGEAAVRVLGFLATAYLARVLGPSGFGVIGFALALTGYFSLAVHQGFLDIGAREIARRPRDVSALAASATVSRVLLAVAAFVALVTTTWMIEQPRTVKVVVVLFGLSTFSLALDTSWVFKGLERNRIVAFALVFGQALYVAGVLSLVKGPDNIVLVPLSQFLGEFSAAALLGVFVLRLGDVRVNLAQGFRLLRMAAFPTLSLLLRSIVFTSDVVILGLLLSAREVGLYTAPYRICFLLLAIAVSIRASYLPAVTRARDDGLDEASSIADRSSELSSAIGLPALVGGAILATPLLSAVFGPEYAAGAPAFRLLLVSIAFIFVFAPIHNVLVAYDRLRLETLIIAGAAILNVVLNLLLIPRYELMGAASATTAAEGFIMVSGWIAVRRLGVRLSLRPIARASMPALVMGASLLGISRLDPPVVVSLAAGIVVWLLAVTALRCVPQDLRPYFRDLPPVVKRLLGDAT